MNLLDLTRHGEPRPWLEGDNIPWNDPDFSQRLQTVDRHMRFILECLRKAHGDRPARILDLACGPGLYTHRLARFGHTVHGIDFEESGFSNV